MLKVDDSGNISLTRGDTGIFTVELVDEEGQPFTPTPADKIRFAMARKYGVSAEETLILKDISLESLTFQIDPEDTKDLEFGGYVYDIEYTDALGNVSTILLAQFKVTKEVY